MPWRLKSPDSRLFTQPTVYPGTDQRKHQSSASLAFVRGIHRWPLNSPHKRPVTRKMFPFDDVIMVYSIHCTPTVNSQSGDRLNIKMTSYRFRDSHHKDKTVSRPSCLYDKHIFTRKGGMCLESVPSTLLFSHLYSSQKLLANPTSHQHNEIIMYLLRHDKNRSLT